MNPSLALPRLSQLPRPARPSLRALLALVALGLVLCFAAGLAWLAPESSGERVGLDELDGLLAEGAVEAAVLRDHDARLEGRTTDGRSFWTAYPTSDATTARLVQQLVAAGAQVSVDPQAGKAAGRVALTTLLPLLVLAAAFGALVSGGGGGTAQVRRFGTLGRRGGGRATAPAVGFADVAGADEAVAELREIVEYLRDPDRYGRVGAEPPKGVLLFGPPGTGKTLIARATAGEAGVPFFSVAGAEFVESLVGVGAARVRDLFARVREAAPAIVFIDEIDAVGRRRGGSAGGSEEREQTLNQLLVELDGFAAATGVVVMGATNRPDVLDPALLRPGRFDRHVVVEPPDLAGRTAILRVHTAARPLGPDVDLDALARRTPGLTGADLANVVNEAALLSVRAGAQHLDARTLQAAVDRVVSGPRRRGHEASADERRRLAVHEAGRAVVGHLAGDEVHRVSVVARGHGAVSADAEATWWTTASARRRASVWLAGQVAEEVVLGSGSSIGEGALHDATRLARDLVVRFGLDPEVGGVRLVGTVDDAWLGGEAAMLPVSEEQRRTVEAATVRVLDDARALARRELETHREALDALVAVLLERESVDGAAVAELVSDPSSHRRRALHPALPR